VWLVLAVDLGSSAVGFVLGATVLGALAWRVRGQLANAQAQAEPEPSAPQPPSPVATEHKEPPPWFAWMADAPMFIDEQQVASFYDAVLRPDKLTTGIQTSTEAQTTTAAKVSYGLKAGALIPGLAEASLGGELSGTEAKKRGAQRTEVPIDNAPRQLQRLALHYLNSFDAEPDMRVWAPVGAFDGWAFPDDAAIGRRPRMLAVLDLPSRTKLVPMAVENQNEVKLAYQALAERFANDGAPPCPQYPEDREDKAGAQRYWKWFNDHWNANAALEVLEEQAKPGRPQWVNYRVPVNDDLTLHLNIVGAGKYDIGVFGYNLLRRAWDHGACLVGTLHTDGMNVLAVYDR
jgi:hypothetical protein